MEGIYSGTEKHYITLQGLGIGAYENRCHVFVDSYAAALLHAGGFSKWGRSKMMGEGGRRKIGKVDSRVCYQLEGAQDHERVEEWQVPPLRLNDKGVRRRDLQRRRMKERKQKIRGANCASNSFPEIRATEGCRRCTEDNLGGLKRQSI